MWMIEFVLASEQSDYFRVTATRQRPVNFRLADDSEAPRDNLFLPTTGK
jgi:hypothetical protein